MPVTRSGSGRPSRREAQTTAWPSASTRSQPQTACRSVSFLPIATTLAALTMPIRRHSPWSTASVHRATACRRFTGCQRDARQSAHAAPSSARGRAAAQPRVEHPAEFVRAALVVDRPGREQQADARHRRARQHRAARRRQAPHELARVASAHLAPDHRLLGDDQRLGRLRPPGQPAQARGRSTPRWSSPPASARSNSAHRRHRVLVHAVDRVALDDRRRCGRRSATTTVPPGPGPGRSPAPPARRPPGQPGHPRWRAAWPAPGPGRSGRRSFRRARGTTSAARRSDAGTPRGGRRAGAAARPPGTARRRRPDRAATSAVTTQAAATTSSASPGWPDSSRRSSWASRSIACGSSLWPASAAARQIKATSPRSVIRSRPLASRPTRSSLSSPTRIARCAGSGRCARPRPAIAPYLVLVPSRREPVSPEREREVIAEVGAPERPLRHGQQPIDEPGGGGVMGLEQADPRGSPFAHAQIPSWHTELVVT